MTFLSEVSKTYPTQICENYVIVANYIQFILLVENFNGFLKIDLIKS